jgi:hypothetical protein
MPSKLLTEDEIYAVARAAGFPADREVSPGVSVAAAMTAIALRESGGNAMAFNGNVKTGDRSYGLWQINMRDKDVCADITKTYPALCADESGLFEPLQNAMAAFVLCRGGNLELMNIAWYILRTGTPYQQRYAANLPAALAAEIRYSEKLKTQNVTNASLGANDSPGGQLKS